MIALAVQAAVLVAVLEMHRQAGLGVRLAERRIRGVVDHLAALARGARVEQDRLVRDGEAARAAAAVAGRPDHLAEEGAAAEEAIAGDLRLVDGAVIEVQVQRRALGHAIADGREARREHRDERVGARAIVVRVGPALRPAPAARLAARRPRGHRRPDAEGRIEVDEIEPHVRGERRADVGRVAVREEVAHSALSGAATREPAAALPGRRSSSNAAARSLVRRRDELRHRREPRPAAGRRRGSRRGLRPAYKRRGGGCDRRAPCCRPAGAARSRHTR